MKIALRRSLRVWIPLLTASLFALASSAASEPVPLKRVVELALSHSTTTAAAAADEQRAFASYHEVRNQYIPTVVVGAGLGASWGFPLTLEGSAPSILNVNAQSALFNPSLRDFMRAARTEWKAAAVQSKDQRDEVIQNATLSYAELVKWERLLSHLKEEQQDAQRMQQVVEQRIQQGVDSKLQENKAKLSAARVRLRLAQAQGSIDVLRQRISQMTGLAASSIETDADSIPSLPEVAQADNLPAKAVQSSPVVQAAEMRSQAQEVQARGEHRALWPSVDFASQYAMLARYNNYDEFYKTFQRNNASLGVSIRFPFLNPSQHAKAQAADAQAIHAKKDAEAAKNQISEETLKLQRSVEQLAAAQQVAELSYEVAQSTLDALQVRLNAGSVGLHDLDDARTQVEEQFSGLQDANFELERARITLLRVTGDLDTWLGVGK